MWDFNYGNDIEVCGGQAEKGPGGSIKYLFVYLNDFKCSYGSSVFVLDLWDALGGEIAMPCAQADADDGGFPQKGPAEMSITGPGWFLGKLWKPEILETGSIDLVSLDLVLSGSLAKSLSKNTLSTIQWVIDQDVHVWMFQEDIMTYRALTPIRNRF